MLHIQESQECRETKLSHNKQKDVGNHKRVTCFSEPGQKMDVYRVKELTGKRQALAATEAKSASLLCHAIPGSVLYDSKDFFHFCRVTAAVSSLPVVG